MLNRNLTAPPPPLPKITHVTLETTGLFFYNVEVELATESVVDAPTWPDSDNTDSDIVAVQLEDGRTLSRESKETGKEFEALMKRLQNENEGRDWDELYDAAWNASCSEWPEDARIKADTEALDRINRILSMPEWRVGMFEDICAILRTVRPNEHADPEWMAH